MDASSIGTSWFEVMGFIVGTVVIFGAIALAVNSQDRSIARRRLRESLEDAISHGRIDDVRATLIVHRKMLPKAVVKDAEWWLLQREEQSGHRVL